MRSVRHGHERIRRADRRAGCGPVRGAAAPANRRAGPRPVSARSLWPPSEAAQVDYETLRAYTLEQAEPPDGLAAARFNRRGLAGLIAWPGVEPVFLPDLLGAARSPWTPHLDPRVSALAAGYQFLLDVAVELGARSCRCPLARRAPHGSHQDSSHYVRRARAQRRARRHRWLSSPTRGCSQS